METVLLETKPLHTEGCAKLMKEIWDSVAPEFSDLVLIEYGGNDAAISLAKNEKIALFSATGSCEMGKAASAPCCTASRSESARSWVVIMQASLCPTAEMKVAVKGVTFSAGEARLAKGAHL